MKKSNLLLLCLLISLVGFSQQLTSFKATDLEQAYIWNPAMTAAWDQIETTLNYNQQWLNFEDAPTHARTGFQIPFPSYNIGLGAFINWDKTGPLSTIDFGFSFSRRFHLGLTYDDQLSVGVSSVFSKYLWNNDELLALDTDDNLILNMERSGPLKTDFGFGIYYATDSSTKYNDSYAFVGMAVNRLLPLFTEQDIYYGNEEAVNFQRVAKANFLLGYRSNSDFHYLEPTLRIEFSAPNIVLFTGGVMFEYNQLLWAGLHYSSDNSFHLSLGGIVKDVLGGDLKVGLRGTNNIGSVVANAQGLSYEVFIGHIYEFY